MAPLHLGGHELQVLAPLFGGKLTGLFGRCRRGGGLGNGWLGNRQAQDERDRSQKQRVHMSILRLGGGV